MEHFTIEARRIRGQGATEAGTEAATVSGEGVARVDATTPVNPRERCTFAINASGMQFFNPDTSAAICN